MVIEITQTQLANIRHHGKSQFPYECCGFLLGTFKNNSKQVQKLLPVDNAAAKQDSHHRFLITAQMYVNAEKHATRQQMNILGYYHSHPNSTAHPSNYDLTHAWIWYSYLIVSIIGGKSVDILSWTLRGDRSAFDQENIKIIL